MSDYAKTNTDHSTDHSPGTDQPRQDDAQAAQKVIALPTATPADVPLPVQAPASEPVDSAEVVIAPYDDRDLAPRPLDDEPEMSTDDLKDRQSFAPHEPLFERKGGQMKLIHTDFIFSEDQRNSSVDSLISDPERGPTAAEVMDIVRRVSGGMATAAIIVEKWTVAAAVGILFLKWQCDTIGENPAKLRAHLSTFCPDPLVTKCIPLNEKRPPRAPSTSELLSAAGIYIQSTTKDGQAQARSRIKKAIDTVYPSLRYLRSRKKVAEFLGQFKHLTQMTNYTGGAALDDDSGVARSSADKKAQKLEEEQQAVLNAQKVLGRFPESRLLVTGRIEWGDDPTDEVMVALATRSGINDTECYVRVRMTAGTLPSSLVDDFRRARNLLVKVAAQMRERNENAGG
jgi:hypothetical protein